MYEQGRGIEQDKKKNPEWLQKIEKQQSLSSDELTELTRSLQELERYLREWAKTQ